jgi:hypothetical protein
MLTAQEENEHTLMGLLGLSEEQAAQKLGFKVTVTGPAIAQPLVDDISALLTRTLEIVAPSAKPDLELAIGWPPVSGAPIVLYASATGEKVTFRASDAPPAAYELLPGLTRRVAACYGAGFILAHVIGGEKYDGLPEPFEVDFETLGLDAALLSRPIHLNGAVLVGAGGVANGFLWGLRELEVSGDLTVVDPKNVGAGNLNRCLFFEETDLGQPKAEILAKRASTTSLKITPHVGEFNDLLGSGGVEMAISTVDSRRVRRSIQEGLPLKVLDASTTDISEVVIHSHEQPTKNACLACIYPHIPEELQRELDVARGLGVTVADVQRDFIDQNLAEKLANAHPELDADDLVGRSLFSLFKAKCAEGTLKTSEAKQTLAPLAFISNLAGLLLALELAKFHDEGRDRGESIYMTLDPWRPPHRLARRKRGRNPNCSFCGRPETDQAFRIVWPEIFGRCD